MGNLPFKIYYRKDNAYLDQHGGGNPKVIGNNGSDYQKWRLQNAGDGYTYFINVRSGNCLDSNHHGDVYTLAKNGGQFQHWKMIKVRTNNLNEDQYFLQNRATGRLLSKCKNSDEILTDICLYKGENQMDGYWTFRGVN